KDAGTPVPPPPAVPGADVATLTVPALGIDAAPVKRYGVDEYGRLDVPQDNHTVGWNPAYAALPGTGGSTFFAAHYEFGGQPGISKNFPTRNRETPSRWASSMARATVIASVRRWTTTSPPSIWAPSCRDEKVRRASH